MSGIDASDRVAYLRYLASSAWFDVSQEVKNRAGWKCQKCFGPPPLQAHHPDDAYQHLRTFGFDLPELLIAVCVDCHEGIHNIHRSPMAQFKDGPSPDRYEDPRVAAVHEHGWFLRLTEDIKYEWLVSSIEEAVESLPIDLSGWARIRNVTNFFGGLGYPPDMIRSITRLVVQANGGATI
jgi:hypothetical protein